MPTSMFKAVLMVCIKLIEAFRCWQISGQLRKFFLVFLVQNSKFSAWFQLESPVGECLLVKINVLVEILPSYHYMTRAQNISEHRLLKKKKKLERFKSEPVLYICIFSSLGEHYIAVNYWNKSPIQKIQSQLFQKLLFHTVYSHWSGPSLTKWSPPCHPSLPF